MRRICKSVMAQKLFGLGVAAALAFGANQAAATHASTEQALTCSSPSCYLMCSQVFGSGGYCDQGTCFCF
jgi:hypothetical protein